MKYTLILLIGISFFFHCCKSNESGQTNDAETRSMVDLAYNPKQVQLNPDEAFISFLVSDIIREADQIILLGQLKKIHQQSFGFNSDTSSSEIRVISDNSLSIEKGQTINCIVESSKSMSDIPRLNLKRVLK